MSGKELLNYIIDGLGLEFDRAIVHVSSKFTQYLLCRNMNNEFIRLHFILWKYITILLTCALG